MITRVDAVLFDLDNTLADRVSAFSRLVTKLWNAEPVLRQSSTIDEALAAFEEWDADGHTSPKRKLFQNAIDRWGALSRDAIELEDWYKTVYPSQFKSDERTLELINFLREAEIPWVIVTNGPTFQHDVVREIGLEDRGAGVVVSEEFGVSKPDQQIFTEGLRLVGVSDPSKCLFVGDNPVADIEGARQMGMPTAWVTRGNKWPAHLAKPDIVIEHVSDLRAVLS